VLALLCPRHFRPRLLLQSRNFKPFQILHRAAYIADKMVMRIYIGIVPGGFSIQRELTHQTRFHQRMQRVVDGGARSFGVTPVQRRGQVVHGRMVGVKHQMFEHGETLRRDPNAGAPESLFDTLIST